MKVLTVILRDDSPYIHLGEPPTFRTVHVHLEPEQLKKFEPKHDQEHIRQCYVEEMEMPRR